LHIKIEERYNTLASAFLFFDVDQNQRINYNEFYNALDALKLKILISDAQRIFDYLDTDKDGWITYNEFCGLDSDYVPKIEPESTIGRKSRSISV
jgi:Ca2+-binding EF-hand superfamily protein